VEELQHHLHLELLVEVVHKTLVEVEEDVPLNLFLIMIMVVPVVPVLS
jgi:hypothetical protein